MTKEHEQNTNTAAPVDALVMRRPMYCPCEEETPDPCPACGATVSGNDKVRGICQAKHPRSAPYEPVKLVLVDKRTGEIV